MSSAEPSDAERAREALRNAAGLTIQDALDECVRITRTHARNFYYGLKLLPPAKRLSLYVVYAWMRLLDDIVDASEQVAHERSDALARFEARTRRAVGADWHEQLIDDLVAADGVLSREQLVMAALANTAGAYELSADDFLAAIEGQRMDVDGCDYADSAAVEAYCDRVASTVGRICIDVWGLLETGTPEARSRARALATRRGIAFQLTNILRDVREDLARGRVYLPADELALHGITAHELVAWSKPAECARFMHKQCARALRAFEESAALDGLVARDSRASLAALTAVYRAILAKIERDPHRAMQSRARLSTWTKTCIALRARFGLLRSNA